MNSLQQNMIPFRLLFLLSEPIIHGSYRQFGYAEIDCRYSSQNG